MKIQIFIYYFCVSKAEQYFVSSTCMFSDKQGCHKISSFPVNTTRRQEIIQLEISFGFIFSSIFQ